MGKFQIGNPGRPKGTPNKTTKLVRETIAEVFDLMQHNDETSLLTWASRNPDDFYKIVAPKIIPNQLTVDQSVSFVPILPKEVADQFPENTDGATAEDI